MRNEQTVALEKSKKLSVLFGTNNAGAECVYFEIGSWICAKSGKNKQMKKIANKFNLFANIVVLYI
jgi:hypothetical protein